MSDDNNDFGDDDFDLDGFDDGFDDLNSNKGTLGDLWRNNVFVKIGVIFLGLAMIIGLFILFGGEKDKSARSSMASGSDVTEVPGAEEISENIRTSIEEDNTRRLEDALRKSESVVPMPVNASKGQIPFEMEKPDEEDPLERWRRLQEEKIVRAAKKEEPEEPEEPEVDTRTPAIQALSEAMSQQMESILGNLEIKGAELKRVANLEYLEGLQKKEEQKIEKERKKRAAAAAEKAKETKEDNEGEILLPAGTIEYAQLLTEANTDVPGPILAQIMTGPFKGARMIGSFSETYNYLTLEFNTIVLDGIDYTANAVAIDPDTTLPGIVTDIDRRYFTRIVLPVAAEFISGFADAISESGTTTLTIQGDTVTETTSNDTDNDQEVASGIGTAGKELSNIIKEIKENHPQLLRVRAGTPMGILFVDSVTDEEDNGNGESSISQQLQNFQLKGNSNASNTGSTSNTGSAPSAN